MLRFGLEASADVTAGAIVLAKANMQELALGGVSVSSLGGQVRNPYDLTRTPGGSSGGVGAGLAAGFALGGLGSDTVNSIRSPASANNLVGLRVTQGLISLAGIMPVSKTQDAIGPITRTVADAATLLQAMAGPDWAAILRGWVAAMLALMATVVGLVAGLDAGDEGFRRDPRLLGCQHDRCAVGVVGAAVVALVAAQFLKAHPNVGLDVFDHVAEVDAAVGIGQRGGNEDFACHGFMLGKTMDKDVELYRKSCGRDGGKVV